MPITPLRYAGYDDCAGEPNVVVDGSPNPGTVLVLSHWPGMPTPPRCAADSSTQMVFRYLDRGADLHGDAAVVTNNHFDQDGLAGIYALTDPEDGLRRRAQLEGLASTGDFGVAPDRSSARVSMAVSALSDPARSPIGPLPSAYVEACRALYEHALTVLPGWLDDPDRCKELWTEEDVELDAAEAALAAGEVRIEERPDVDLAVVTLPAGRSSGHRFAGRRFTGIHPIALHSATERTTILLLDPAGGRHHLTCRYEGWVQFRSRRIPRRVDLAPLAGQLTASEPGGARWASTPPGELTPELHTTADGPASSLDPRELAGTVARFLAEAPPAWDPYRTDE